MERLSLADMRVCVQLICFTSLDSISQRRAGKDKEDKHAKSWELVSSGWGTLSSLPFYPRKSLKEENQVCPLDMKVHSWQMPKALRDLGNLGESPTLPDIEHQRNLTLESGGQVSVKNWATTCPSHAFHGENKMMFASHVFPKRWWKVLASI